MIVTNFHVFSAYLHLQTIKPGQHLPVPSHCTFMSTKYCPMTVMPPTLFSIAHL